MKVAVAVITDVNQHVLIARRPAHASHAGMWEFPGGKLEANESASSALIREIKEEVGLDVKGYDFLGEVNHSYTVQQVSLQVFHVHHFEGEAFPYEAQMDLRWVDFMSLGDFDFPAANDQVIALFRQKVL